jgi:hypothetical protein
LIAGSRWSGGQVGSRRDVPGARLYLADSCFQWWSGDASAPCPVAQPSNANTAAWNKAFATDGQTMRGLPTGLPQISRAMVVTTTGLDTTAVTTLYQKTEPVVIALTTCFMMRPFRHFSSFASNLLPPPLIHRSQLPSTRVLQAISTAGVDHERNDESPGHGHTVGILGPADDGSFSAGDARRARVVE